MRSNLTSHRPPEPSDRRLSLWSDQGDGLFPRRTSAIIDGCTADVLAPETELAVAI